MDEIGDMFDEAVELLVKSDQEVNLENLIKASIYLKKLYELNAKTIDMN